MSGERELRVYSREEIQEALKGLPEWGFGENYLFREYRTKSWRETVFVFNTLAGLAEVHWHHPEVEVGYKRLLIKLTTHEAGGVTHRDVELAREIEKVLSLLAKRWYNT